MRQTAWFVAILFLLVGALGATSAYQSQASSGQSGPGKCSPVSGSFETSLTPQSFGSVTTYKLPAPTEAPNSVVAAPDGSVWFGEVALRGVAHLFLNGTLVEYPWPSSLYSDQEGCYDLDQLWGIVLWNGAVWASDHYDDQLLGLTPSNDSFQAIHLRNGDSPLFLAVDSSDRLWFTTSSVPAQIGVVDSVSGPVSYFSVPGTAGEFASSVLLENSTLAYVVAVSQTNNLGHVFSFNPSSTDPTFQEVGDNETLLAPYSVAALDGGLWVGEHEASDLAFLNLTTDAWSFYPTSINPEVPLTLPYYLLSNGSVVWFNEHDSNRIGEISGDGTYLTEYNVSQSSIKSGIGNLLTIGLDKNLLWFTEWTGNVVGFVNASVTPGFTISSSASSGSNIVSPGGSLRFTLNIEGLSSSPLTIQFSDSESNTAVPVDLLAHANVTTIQSLDGLSSVAVTLDASSATPVGRYLVLATVTDGATLQSVYIPVTVGS